MKDSKIPKSIQIMGRKIKIVWRKKLRHDSDANGLACFRDNEIHLHKSGEGESITLDVAYEVYLHELTHWIFHLIGEPKLRDNEQLVSLFSRCLDQALKDAKY